MESTVTETVTTESTPTGSVQTHEVTTERDEGDITESWLSAQFDAVRTAIMSLLSEQAQALTSLQARMETMENRLPSNLTELLSQQQSTITNLTGQITETVQRLLTPPAVVEVVPSPAVEENPVAIEEPVAVAVPQESPRRRPRAV